MTKKLIIEAYEVGSRSGKMQEVGLEPDMGGEEYFNRHEKEINEALKKELTNYKNWLSENGYIVETNLKSDDQLLTIYQQSKQKA